MERVQNSTENSSELECALGYHTLGKWSLGKDGSKFRECACGHIMRICFRDKIIIHGTRMKFRSCK